MKATGALSGKVHRSRQPWKSVSELWVRNHPPKVEGAGREEAWVPALIRALLHRAVLLMIWVASVLPAAQWMARERTSRVCLGSILGFRSVTA